MKSRLLSSLGIGLLWVAAISLPGCMRPEVLDDVLGFELTDLNGETVSLSQERFAGKVVLVEIWGTWCPPCIEQMPYLIHWQSAYRERGLEIVALEFAQFKPMPEGSYEDAMRSYLEERGVNYTVVQAGMTKDRASILPELRNFQGFPTSIFIARDGKVRLVKAGFSSSEQNLYKRMIETLLDE